MGESWRSVRGNVDAIQTSRPERADEDTASIAADEHPLGVAADRNTIDHLGAFAASCRQDQKLVGLFVEGEELAAGRDREIGEALGHGVLGHDLQSIGADQRERPAPLIGYPQLLA